MGLSVVGCRLSVVGCRLSVVGCRLSVKGKWAFLAVFSTIRIILPVFGLFCKGLSLFLVKGFLENRLLGFWECLIFNKKGFVNS